MISRHRFLVSSNASRPRWLRAAVLMSLVSLAFCFTELQASDAPWADMSVEEKLDVLQASALQLDDDGKVSNGNLYSETDILWTCIAAFLVFFMQAVRLPRRLPHDFTTGSQTSVLH